VILLAGCGDLDSASASAGIARNDLVAELAAQLGKSSALTYSATYQLAGGATATVTQAQRPARAAYRYPGGQVLVTTAALTRCSPVNKALTCTMTAPPVPATALPGTLLTDAGKAGLVTQPAALAMLNQAALDPDVTVDQHDTTIAGHHATCVDLANVDGAAAREFGVCITNEGVLGSFNGTLSDQDVDLALTQYADRAEADAFDPPSNAKLIDQR
jgi:hypothetical protein